MLTNLARPFAPLIITTMLAGCGSSGVTVAPPSQPVFTFFANQPVATTSPLLSAQIPTKTGIANLTFLGLRSSSGVPDALQEVIVQYPSAAAQNAHLFFDSQSRMQTFALDDGTGHLAFAYPSPSGVLITAFNDAQGTSTTVCEPIAGNETGAFFSANGPNCIPQAAGSAASTIAGGSVPIKPTAFQSVCTVADFVASQWSAFEEMLQVETNSVVYAAGPGGGPDVNFLHQTEVI